MTEAAFTAASVVLIRSTYYLAAKAASMYRPFDTENWHRREAFEYFGSFAYPFFNVCLNIDISILKTYCRTSQHSINHALHFCSLIAANEIEEFRLRYKDNTVVLYDRVDGAATVLLPDNSIRFCIYELSASFPAFSAQATLREERVRNTRGSDPRTGDQDMIHYSVVPWISFTSITHPRSGKPGDSIPKISFGQYFTSEGKIMVPISIEVNHALMDGYQVASFLSAFQRKIEAFTLGVYAS